MPNQQSAIEQFLTDEAIPDIHLTCIKNAWKTARMIDCYSSWKYVAGILHGAYMYSMMIDEYESELIFLKEIALLRSLAAHNG